MTVFSFYGYKMNVARGNWVGGKVPLAVEVFLMPFTVAMVKFVK